MTQILVVGGVLVSIALGEDWLAKKGMFVQSDIYSGIVKGVIVLASGGLGLWVIWDVFNTFL